MPIFIEQPPRDCIVVQGKKYCRDEDWTGREIGVVILLLAVLAVYCFYVLNEIAEGFHPARTAALYFGLPLLIISLALIAFGAR